VALVSCPDCQGQISTRAAACPHCGAPVSADLAGKPAAGSASAHRTGRQRSRLRQDIGNAIALIGLPAAIVIGAVWGALPGFATAIGTLAVAIFIAYR
jgi:hypothetical protein